MGYARTLFGLEPCEIPEQVEEHVLPAIELERAVDVPGVVRDESGRPVVGASVRARWKVDEGPNRRRERVVDVLSDKQGEFVIRQVNAPAGGAGETMPSAELRDAGSSPRGSHGRREARAERAGDSHPSRPYHGLLPSENTK